MARPLYDDEKFFSNYAALRKDEISANDIEEIPNLYSLLPNLKNKNIVDLGCGTGNNCRFFAENGAKQIIGIDISEKMLQEARRLSVNNNISYSCMDMECLSLPQNYYHLVTSSLAMHYISNFKNLASVVYDSLTVDGLFVFSQEHPIYTSPQNGIEWQRDKNGDPVGFFVESYNIPGCRTVEWLGGTVVKYHRTVAEIVNSLISVGFVLEKLLETKIPEKYFKYRPEYKRTKHVPDYLMIKVRKPQG